MHRVRFLRRLAILRAQSKQREGEQQERQDERGTYAAHSKYLATSAEAYSFFCECQHFNLHDFVLEPVHLISLSPRQLKSYYVSDTNLS